MKSHTKLTIIRNRHRARDLRRFRELVETYFECNAYDEDGQPMHWEGAQTARALIHRMLPRVVQVVRAAGIGATDVSTDPGTGIGDSDALNHIFTSRYVDTGGQEILDLIDMALGVYDEGRFAALGRTVNPLHYAGTAVAFLASLPRRFFGALGLRRPRSQTRGIRPKDVARLEAMVSRMANAEELIETRFAEIRDRQAQERAETTRQLTELAERLDFTERVLTQQRPMNAIEPPKDADISTPV